MKQRTEVVSVEGPAVSTISTVELAVVILDALSGCDPTPPEMREIMLRTLLDAEPDVAKAALRAGNAAATYFKEQVENARPVQ